MKSTQAWGHPGVSSTLSRLTFVASVTAALLSSFPEGETASASVSKAQREHNTSELLILSLVFGYAMLAHTIVFSASLLLNFLNNYWLLCDEKQYTIVVKSRSLTLKPDFCIQLPILPPATCVALFKL